MKRYIDVNVEAPVVHLTTEIVYSHRTQWANVKYIPLQMSIIRPRTFFPYDDFTKRPVILYLAGGGFTEMDRNAWIPNLTWFAQHGYTVASIDYSDTARTRFPRMCEDIKTAVRFLKANADEYCIDPDRIYVMGESAGGYLAAFTALTNGDRQYDVGEYLDYDSDVKAAVCWYPAVDLKAPENAAESTLPPDIGKFIPVQNLVKPDSVPVMILQGTDDSILDYTAQSDLLYEALEKNGVKNEYIMVNSADHADPRFVQPEVMQMMLDFIESL